MTIHEIDQAIMACIDPETGEVDAEKLTALQMERDTKVENIANWILDITGDVAKIDEEIVRLTNRRNAAQKKADDLKQYLRYVLADTAYKGATVTVNFRKTKSVADMDDETIAKLPVEFINEKVIPEQVIRKPDKLKIRKAIDEGWQIAGVEIVEKVTVTVK